MTNKVGILGVGQSMSALARILGPLLATADARNGTWPCRTGSVPGLMAVSLGLMITLRDASYLAQREAAAPCRSDIELRPSPERQRRRLPLQAARWSSRPVARAPDWDGGSTTDICSMRHNLRFLLPRSFPLRVSP